MDSTKRTWIYTGLAIAAGVGLVTLVASDSTPGQPIPLPPGGGPPPQGVPIFAPLKSSDRVLLVGDSLAQGLTAPMKQLASDLGASFFGDGKQSTRINQWSSQPWLAADIATSQPTFILVSLGTNDMKLLDPSSESSALQQLVATLKATGATIVWITPPTMPFPDQGVRAMIASTKLPLFLSESLMIPRGPDGIHATTAGYAGWAGSVWQYLLRGNAISGLGSVARVRRRRAAPRKVVG